MPQVLRKYIPGQPEFLPYVKELPKDSTSLKAKGKVEGGKGEKGGKEAPPAAQVPGEGEVVERPKHKHDEVRS